jgi:hypothetical protein|eukprot:COSAG06_NODE_7034_length_2664_cov_2.735283_2_plen_104_part_00
MLSGVREGTGAGEGTAYFLAKEEDAGAIGVWVSGVLCVCVSCILVHLTSVVLVFYVAAPVDEKGDVVDQSGDELEEVWIDLVAGMSNLLTLVWVVMVIVFTQR